MGRRCPELVAEWPRRLAVARDIVAALHYLHAVLKPPVVHGDVKPSNVLLDADLRARLADFGLARVDSDPDPGDKLESGMIAEGADANENGLDAGCDDDVSVVAESTVTTNVDGQGDVIPKSPEDDEGGFSLASPTEGCVRLVRYGGRGGGRDAASLLFGLSTWPKPRGAKRRCTGIAAAVPTLVLCSVLLPLAFFLGLHE